MYITQEDYEEMTGQPVPENYKKLELLASAELDSVTRFYYVRNELADDFKSRQFKKALLMQIDFLIANDGMTVEDLNNQPDSVRMGETTVTYNRTGTGREIQQRQSALSQDALNVLKGTGLLYRGANYA